MQNVGELNFCWYFYEFFVCTFVGQWCWQFISLSNTVGHPIVFKFFK